MDGLLKEISYLHSKYGKDYGPFRERVRQFYELKEAEHREKYNRSLVHLTPGGAAIYYPLCMKELKLVRKRRDFSDRNKGLAFIEALRRDMFGKGMVINGITEEEASLKAHRERTDTNPFRNARYTLTEALQIALKERSLTLEPPSIKTYRETLNSLIAFLLENGISEISPAAVKPSDLRPFIEYKQSGELRAHNTQKSLKGNISSLFQVMVDRELIPYNPVKSLRIFHKGRERTPPDPITILDALRFWQWCDTNPRARTALRSYRATMIQFYTFLRYEEICKLTGRDIDLLNKKIYLREGKGKTKIARTIPIYPALHDMFMDWPELAERDRRLFPDKASQIRNRIGDHLKAAGLGDFKPYWFKPGGIHYLWKEKGVPLHLIRIMTGHKTERAFFGYIEQFNFLTDSGLENIFDNFYKEKNPLKD